MISRRDLLASGAAIGASSLLRLPPAVEGFRVVHMTDLHMRDHGRAREGIRLAVDRVLELSPRPDFVILGGDAGDGLMAADQGRAGAVFAMVQEELGRLEMPVHAVVGNHDIFGWGSASSSEARDPAYGKSLFAERFVRGPLYRPLDHRGWRFLFLDSIQPAASGQEFPYQSVIDEAQLSWLREEVRRLGSTPAVLILHSPLLTGYMIYCDGPYAKPQYRMVLENAKEVHELIKTSSIKAVLQGHTHVREDLVYAGRRHITSGAVCGSWWSGPRFGIDPCGFSVLDFGLGDVRWTYVPTGFVF